MTLVDSSSWVHCLRRRGDAHIVARVRRLMESGDAAWCAAIRLELWNGVGSDDDRRILRDFEQTLPELPITDEVWQQAYRLASRCRKGGKTAPAIDVLIAACARHHGIEMEHADSHFDFLMTLRAWELDKALTDGPDAFYFVYEDGKVIDRNPPPPGAGQTILIGQTGEHNIAGARRKIEPWAVRVPSSPV